MAEIECDITQIRNEFSKLIQHMNWHFRTGRWSTYNWVNDGQDNLMKLCEMLKVDLTDGHLKKQDRLGKWR